MANEIAIPESLQKTIGPLAQRFAEERTALIEGLEKLKNDELSSKTRTLLAVEYDTRAKKFWNDVLTAFEPTVAVLHQTHKAATTIRGRIIEPAQEMRSLCNKIVEDYKRAIEDAKKVTPAPAERAEIVAQEETVLEGVATVKTWDGEVEDFGKLVDHIAAHHELLFLLLHVQGELNRYLTRMKGQIELPGVRIIERFGKRNRNSDG